MYQQSGFKCVNCGHYNTSADFTRAENAYPSVSNTGYTKPNHNYPGGQNVYPGTQNNYPKPQNEYPGAQHNYPRPPNEYPESQHSYPKPQNPFPGSQNEYSIPQNQYQAAQYGYPIPQNVYPGMQNEYSMPQSQYPVASHGYSKPEYPGAQYEYPKSQNPYSYPHGNMPGQTAPFPPATPNPTSHNLDSSRNRSEEVRNIPTVFPADEFDPERDAEILRVAMKGFGTDEEAIINILTRRSMYQRIEIEKAFKSMYGKDLFDDLKSELSGNLKKLVVALMTPWDVFLAKEIRDATEGFGTNEDTLIEIMCSLTNSQIQMISQAYFNLTDHSLEDDLIDDTSGSLKRLMVSLSIANRDEDNYLDDNAAYEDAQKLLEAGELKFGTDESTFNQILCKRSFSQLRLIFKKYEEITGHSIKKAIKSEYSGDIEKALLAIVRCVLNRPMFFAKQIHKSMKGFVTNHRKLIRLIVSRCEIDLGNVKEAYSEKYYKSLEETIEDETSGDYKKCLIALLGR